MDLMSSQSCKGFKHKPHEFLIGRFRPHSREEFLLLIWDSWGLEIETAPWPVKHLSHVDQDKTTVSKIAYLRTRYFVKVSMSDSRLITADFSSASSRHVSNSCTELKHIKPKPEG